MRFTLLLQLILLLFNNAISQCTYTFPVSATLVCSDNGSGLPDYGSPSPVMNNRVFVSSSSSFLCEAASMGISAEMEPTCSLNDIWITDDGTLWYYYSVNKFDIHPVSSIAWYNSGNSTSGATITMNTAGSASSTPTLCINTALTNITHATTGATGISDDGVAGANGLPGGVSASWSGNVITISGTPSASGTFNYTIPLSGGCGSVDATGTITVTADNTAGVASSTPTLCINTALTNITHHYHRRNWNK